MGGLLTALRVDAQAFHPAGPIPKNRRSRIVSIGAFPLETPRETHLLAEIQRDDRLDIRSRWDRDGIKPS